MRSARSYCQKTKSGSFQSADIFVLANIREAIELHIESLIAAGEAVPEDVGPMLLKVV
jgi:hypothetical protein